MSELDPQIGQESEQLAVNADGLVRTIDKAVQRAKTLHLSLGYMEKDYCPPSFTSTVLEVRTKQEATLEALDMILPRPEGESWRNYVDVRLNEELSKET